MCVVRISIISLCQGQIAALNYLQDNMLSATLIMGNGTNCCYRSWFTHVVLVVKVGVLEDFSTEPHPLHTETISVKTSRSSHRADPENRNHLFVPFIFLPMFFYSGRSATGVTSNKEAFEASKKTVSDSYSPHTFVVTCLWHNAIPPPQTLTQTSCSEV